MSESALLQIKIISRKFLGEERIETGKILFCQNTSETFFDENTRTRICLGAVESVDFESELRDPTEKDIGKFVLILQENKVKYATSDLEWKDIVTRDDMSNTLGGIDYFLPHNLYENGQLIAPRTLASCVYSDEGTPISELMEGVQEFIDEFNLDGFDADRITSGTIGYERLPKEARMDFIPVADQEARLALTKDQVQNNDVVQEDSTGKMFFVIDDTKLGSEAAFKEFTVGSIPWNAVINRPSRIILKNGAMGAVNTTTSSSALSQELNILVTLNVDYAEQGILNKLRGGTGNQTGTAAFIENDRVETKMNLAGFGENDKMIQSQLISAENGVISATGFKSTDKTKPTEIPNIDTSDIDLKYDSTIDGVNKDNTTSNIINFGDNLIIGDSKIPTKLNGSNIEISAVNKITNKIGGNEALIIDANKMESKLPVTVKDKLAILSDGVNGGTMEFNNLGTCVAYATNALDSNQLPSNMSSSTYESLVKGTVISNDNNTYAIKRNKGSGYFPDADNIIEVGNDNVKVNGDAFIGHDTNIYGSLRVKGKMYGTATQAVNADLLDGKHGSEYMLKDGTNNTNPPVVVTSAAPAGRTNCLWINSTNGIANYWTGTKWEPISNTWKT